MDYIFFSGLVGTTLLMLNVSYDICCQWSINLWTRMATFPEGWRLDTVGIIWTYLVPKFHLPAHVEKCQTAYLFNYTRGVGRTDGEAPERGWANINAAATSTKEMGPGSRRDILDDHFGNWNPMKIVAMGQRFNVTPCRHDTHIYMLLQPPRFSARSRPQFQSAQIMYGHLKSSPKISNRSQWQNSQLQSRLGRVIVINPIPLYLSRKV